MSERSSGLPLRALVVDDEAVVRRLLIAALTREGFKCDEAADGQKAAALSASVSYQLVITDLAMPNRHGHSLIVDLLARNDRPMVVVLTGVLDPRLAKDLMARGVDDIVFKPVEFLPLAAKLRSLVDRRQCLVAAAVPTAPRNSRLLPGAAGKQSGLQPVTAE